MLKFINLKKLTAQTLFSILVVGSFLAGTSDKKAVAACANDNNGHGNNAPFTHKLTTGKLTIGHYDPSNPGNNRDRLIDDLDAGLQSPGLNNNRPFDIKFVGNPGVASYNLTTSEATAIVNAHPDWEIKGSTKLIESGCGNQDSDGIEDAVELGTDFDTPLDTDNDGTPNYADTDSDNDGVLDSAESTGDTDNDGIPNYIDAVNNTPPATTPGSSPNNTPSTTTNAPASITLTGTIRDFKAKEQSGGHPDFQKAIGTEKNIVTTQLGADQKPVYAKSSGGTTTTTGKESFDQWYRNVSGVNQSKEYPIVLTRQTDGTYKYQNNDFFPINNELFGNYSNGKNFHFTYEIHTQFTYKGGETFNFSGDDDVWVYINGKRVIDLGGVHSSQSQSVTLDTLGLTVGQNYDLDFFFAERHTTQSNFTITTNIALEAAPSPDGDEDKDTISNILERSDLETDTDGDATPDYKDTDSDNNKVLDSVEVGVPASPSDSDSDGIPNFKDTDDDGNSLTDKEEIGSNPLSPTNTDSQDLPDYQDVDDDNDGIVDKTDGLQDSPLDSDNIPNHHDPDSDGDTLNDSFEGDTDAPIDSDLDPNFLDLDSDGDNIPDLNEKVADSNDSGAASDVTPSSLTAPKTLDNVDGDDKKNYVDPDSDNDGYQDNVDNAPYTPQTD
jgi:fibro-slime domain-containing protein